MTRSVCSRVGLAKRNPTIKNYSIERETNVVNGTPVITIKRYTHGPGIDAPLAIEQKGEVYYYHSDGLGSITTITDARQKTVESYTYDSYGAFKRKGDRVKSRYAYTAREWDEETGLYYYRARYYDPKAGRFITRDPIGFKGGVNVYNYVKANPVNAVDPWGENPIAAVAVGGVVVCGTAEAITGTVLFTTVTTTLTAADATNSNLLMYDTVGIPIDQTVEKDCPKKNDNGCPPCMTVTGKLIPLNTLAYIGPHYPKDPSVPEHGVLGPHYNIFMAQQAPLGTPKQCQCFWQPQKAVELVNLPLGAIPFEAFVQLY